MCVPAGCVRLRVCTCKRIGTALSDGTAGGTGLFRASVACARLCASAHRMVVCGRGGVVRFSFSVVFVRERPQSSSCERSRLRFPELTPRPRCHIHPAEVDPSSDRPSPAPRVDLSLATWPIAQRLIQSASRHVPGCRAESGVRVASAPRRPLCATTRCANTDSSRCEREGSLPVDEEGALCGRQP